MEVSGESLRDYRIHDRDILVYKKNVTNRDLKPESICVVYIIATGEMLAKKVRYSEGRVALIAGAEGYKPLYYEPDQIEIRGIVFQRVTLIGPSGGFRKQGDDDIPF
jgi:SOS-response transcriptional repressor LexA